MSQSDGVLLDGDCFYNSVRAALATVAGAAVPSVAEMRRVRNGGGHGADV